MLKNKLWFGHKLVASRRGDNLLGVSMSQLSKIESASYLEKIALVAKLSPLFSDSSTPFVHSRFAERIFCLDSGSQDLARQDISFDAKGSSLEGIGVKTYVASSKSTAKVEKVAEFTTYATQGRFLGLAGEALAREVSKLRNKRLASDCAEVEVDLAKSYYHCIVRTPGEIFYIEQDFGPVNLETIVATDRFGKETGSFLDEGHVYFKDDSHGYVFNIAKNVLYRRFDPLKGFVSDSVNLDQKYDLVSLMGEIRKLMRDSVPNEFDSAIRDAAEDFVVLPLYSSTQKTVSEASGINQWNAKGRVRKFSEAYIPVPREVHKTRPNFFPARDVTFNLKLPNGAIVLASICQQGDKALMSNPNTELCRWLFSTIDGSFQEAERRMGTENKPYTYSDLLAIGKDAVKVRRVVGKSWGYEMESAPIGSYEAFIEGLDF